MVPLRSGKPTDTAAVGIRGGGVVDSELDGVDVLGIVGRRTWRVELSDGDFDVDGADLVRTRIARESGDRVELRQVGAEFGSSGRLLCRRVHGGECNCGIYGPEQ